MRLNDHARVLFAYMARLAPRDRDIIDRALKDWDHACLNLPVSSQSMQHQRTARAIEEAIANMTDHDLELLREVVNNAGH